jgi:hypothetical protein
LKYPHWRPAWLIFCSRSFILYRLFEKAPSNIHVRGSKKQWTQLPLKIMVGMVALVVQRRHRRGS